MVRVRSQLLFAALWIILPESEGDSEKFLSVEDEIGQILPYWEPEPKPDIMSRRMADGRNFVIQPINAVHKNHSLRRGRPREPFVQWSSHEEDAKMTTKRRAGVKVSKKNKYYNNGKGQMRQMEGKEEKARSTRIAPLQLMQQEGQGPVEKEENTVNAKGVKEPFILNAYFVEKQFTKLLSEFDEAEFSSEILGRTVSYINIVLFKISQRGSKYFRADETKYVENEKKEKKILFIVHALSPMGLGSLYSLTLETHLKLLMSLYIAHLDKFDIFLIPMANPDGYLKTKAVIHWNKNVALNSECPGVDVDRNFDVAWNNSHVQTSSCVQHYPGVTPFSEPESRAVRDIFHRLSHKIVAYFHVHGGSYHMNTFKGDAVLYPKGYTDHQSDDDKYIDLKGEIDDAIKNANFKVLSVTVDTLYNWYGKVSGTSVDYASSVYGIPYAMELVMQLYESAEEAPFEKIEDIGGYNINSLDYHALSEIWKRVIDVIFTNIHKKLEATESA